MLECLTKQRNQEVKREPSTVYYHCGLPAAMLHFLKDPQPLKQCHLLGNMNIYLNKETHTHTHTHTHTKLSM